MSDSQSQSYQSLATYRRCVERVSREWPRFLTIRSDRLRHGGEPEKVAEGILEDMFTGVLDWSRGDLVYQVSCQVGRADIILSRNLEKFLVLEVKRPGSFRPVRHAFENALGQAGRYAADQKVKIIAVSDGRYLYAADVAHGGLSPRVFVDLSENEPPQSLWWLSLHGIYRPCAETVIWPSPPEAQTVVGEIPTGSTVLHPKYDLPASCFAYVGNAGDPATWKLPYLLPDRSPDEKRLPKAIQALLTSYRGAKVGGIPEGDLPDVLVRLARAARSLGRMPPQAVNPAPAYQQLATVLDQLGVPKESI